MLRRIVRSAIACRSFGPSQVGNGFNLTRQSSAAAQGGGGAAAGVKRQEEPSVEQSDWYQRVWTGFVETSSKAVQEGSPAAGAAKSAAWEPKSTMLVRRWLRLMTSEDATASGEGNHHGGGGVTDVLLPRDLIVHLWRVYLEVRVKGHADKLLGDAVRNLGHSSPKAAVTTQFVEQLFKFSTVSTPSTNESSNGTKEASVHPLLAFLLQTEEIGRVDDATVRRQCEALTASLQQRTSSGSSAKVSDQMDQLRMAMTPLYERWWEQSLSLPDGMMNLMTLRKDIMFLQQVLSAYVAAERKGASSTAVKPSTSTTKDATVSVAANSNELLPKVTQAQGALRILEKSLTGILKQWLSTTWLLMEELHWNRTPAVVFERVQYHEAVHTFASLSDVKYRCQPTPNRHLFGFFHPAVVGSPLAMIQVALTRGIANNVDHVLNEPKQKPSSSMMSSPVTTTPPPPVDTAIFYSITSTQSGLKQIDLGHHLILSVVSSLKRSHPHIVTFSTLSPIPGYGAWLRHRLNLASGDMNAAVAMGSFRDVLFPSSHRVGAPFCQVLSVLPSLAHHAPSSPSASPRLDDDATADTQALIDVAVAFLSSKSSSPQTKSSKAESASNGQDEPQRKLQAAVTSLMMAACEMTSSSSPAAIVHASALCLLAMIDAGVFRALSSVNATPSQTRLITLMKCSIAHYLTQERRRQRALDPVANFHLGNGALLYRINELANQTERGNKESCCFMVNYLYELQDGVADSNALKYRGVLPEAAPSVSTAVSPTEAAAVSTPKAAGKSEEPKSCIVVGPMVAPFLPL